MIKRLVDTKDLILLEINRIHICGKDICIDAVKDLPAFVPIILVFLSDEDKEYELIIKKIPAKYNAMCFPLQGKAYAAFFPASGSEQAYSEVMAYMKQLYPDPVYAYDFNSLIELEEFITNKVILKTDESALYKTGNQYRYVTNHALLRLKDYFITPQLLSEKEATRHCEKLIGTDAYDKIMSYIGGTGGTSEGGNANTNEVKAYAEL